MTKTEKSKESNGGGRSVDAMVRRAEEKGFCSGIITALSIIALYDKETLYREVIDTLGKDVKKLIKHARMNDELEFSGLLKYKYARRTIA